MGFRLLLLANFVIKLKCPIATDFTSTSKTVHPTQNYGDFTVSYI